MVHISHFGYVGTHLTNLMTAPIYYVVTVVVHLPGVTITKQKTSPVITIIWVRYSSGQMWPMSRNFMDNNRRIYRLHVHSVNIPLFWMVNHSLLSSALHYRDMFQSIAVQTWGTLMLSDYLYHLVNLTNILVHSGIMASRYCTSKGTLRLTTTTYF